MSRKMYEGQWSPFDPQWYGQAFDKFISVADYQYNQEDIRSEGYSIPDGDGSRSSMFRREAILNNSFNEDVLRDTLTDIYSNSSHKLIASNHDDVGFFSWTGHMSDMTITENTFIAEFKIPCESFITPAERDLFKLGQYYRKWITATDILNDWKTFKWHCLLFINQKVYSDYELRIDDHEITIRFKTNKYWIKDNVPVYIYKMGTNAQCRVKISRELVVNQWKYEMPASYLSDQRVCNNKHIIVAFNKIGDPEIRSDGNTHVDTLGDNLEFLTIEDGIIDLSIISNFNKVYIQSESTEWLWMSVFVPKFLQEYPILLPVDTVYRPYEPAIHPVAIDDNGVVRTTHINDEGTYKLYIDANGGSANYANGWKQIIRPVVLSDAFSTATIDEPYEEMAAILDKLKVATVDEADAIEHLRDVLEYDDATLSQDLDNLVKLINDASAQYNAFLKSRHIATNPEYNKAYTDTMSAIEDIRIHGKHSEWLTRHTNDSDGNFWLTISPLVYIPRFLVEHYEYIGTISALGSRRILWTETDQYLGKIRYRRPIDSTDFWTFEFYPDEQVWRPIPLNMVYHFPDVYLPEYGNEVPAPGRIFKAFFFYSDTINVLDPVGDIVEATPSWDEDVQEYHIDRYGTYRDLFMEKFYWMGVNKIYQGVLLTKSRWELLEYVYDNPSYERFNQLFLQTMDPYFKLGLATYLKSANFEFPFDDAIAKLKESIGTKFLDYQRITNFEVYLNKSWIPSYFDYAVKILDNWAWEKYLVRRPSSSFSTARLLPTLTSVQEDLHRASTSLFEDIKFIQESLSDWDYGLDREPIENLSKTVTQMYEMINGLMKFITELDPEIYSIDDVNHISETIIKHTELLEAAEIGFENINRNVLRNNKWESKKTLLQTISPHIQLLPNQIINMTNLSHSFDISKLMDVVNNLMGYLEYPKDDHDSLIGQINEFNSPWPATVKEKRNELFIATGALSGTYDSNKLYTDEEINDFYECLLTAVNCIAELRTAILESWDVNNIKYDNKITDGLDYSETILTQFSSCMTEYMSARKELLSTIFNIESIADQVKEITHSSEEAKCLSEMRDASDNLIYALSYIAGTNNREEALTHLSELKDGYAHWMDAIALEEDLFNRLMRLSTPPIAFVETMNQYSSRLNKICMSIDILSDPRNNLPQNPTYSDIYSIKDSSIYTGGIYNKENDKAYIPYVGIYDITKVDDTDGSAVELALDDNYRITTFRNATSSDPDFITKYDIITSGNGFGVSIAANGVDRVIIINDKAVEAMIIRIQGFIKKLSTNLMSCNPHKNNELNSIIKQLQDIHAEWNGWTFEQVEHLSDTTVTNVNELFRLIENIPSEVSEFISIRETIDVGTILHSIRVLESNVYKYTEENKLQDQSFCYYDEMIRQAFNVLNNFYGNGIGWASGQELKSIIDSITPMIVAYETHVVSNLTDELKTECTALINSITEARSSIQAIPNSLSNVKLSIEAILNKCETTKTSFQVDEWYRINTVRVASDVGKFEVGDIVEMIPELPTDSQGNPITDNQEVILNDKLLFQITRVDDGHPTDIRPMLDYALPYKVWGIRHTKTLIGRGVGLIIDVYSQQVTLDDSTLYRTATLPNKSPDIGVNDLIKLRFENTHDSDIGYEVYCGGEHITDFIKRHDTSNSGEDIIYIKASKVLELQNLSVVIPEENHIVYKLDNISIKDPGAGYAVGQNVFVDTENSVIQLRVDKLDGTPYKGIGELGCSTSQYYNDIDPTCENSHVLSDSMNNIDDEYNNGYYDNLTSDGIEKPATFSYDRDTYVFLSKRFDNLPVGDRNATYPYPDIESDETGGDPDFPGLFLGNRIDNSQHPLSDPHRYNGIIHVIPPTDPFIPVDRRFPTNHSPKGEYQLIQKLRIHNSVYETNDDVTRKFDASLLNAAMVIGDLEVDDYTDLPKHAIEWPEGKIGKAVIVRQDSSNGGHRMVYRIRTFIAAGFFVYDRPEVADLRWDHFDVDWMNTDNHADYPGMRTQYPDANWETSPSYRKIQRDIDDGKVNKELNQKLTSNQTYIDNLSIDDISVFNYTTKEWEDLSDTSRWKLETYNEPETGRYGFTLTFMADLYHGAVLVKELSYSEVKYIWDGNWKNYKEPNPPEINKETVENIWDLNGAGYVDPTDDEMKYLMVRTIWETDGEGYVEPKEELWLAENADPNEVQHPFSYDMRLYINKEALPQSKNSSLKRNAVIKVDASISSEEHTPEIKSYVDVGKTLRVRKDFPYTQKQMFTIGTDPNSNPLGYEMNFKLSQYNQFRNELHLEDVHIYNKSADRWEDILNSRMFEVRFKNDKSIGHGTETNTRVSRVLISDSGTGFINGNAWAWNEEYQVHLFGEITSDYRGDGHLISFTPERLINVPKDETITLEFIVYQSDTQTDSNRAIIYVEFTTETTEVWDDGYIHNVTNPLAPLPEEFKIICLYDIEGQYEYEVSIDQGLKRWTFIEPEWIVAPTFHIPNRYIPKDRLYIATESGRLPLLNPSTGKPTIIVEYSGDGTDVTYLSLYRRYEPIIICEVPYPMRSVYVLRQIPKSGYIDLKGKLNKPLNKKYFEFWVNGRLLDDEVTVITPTKLFLHGLRSLRNFEIIEINRDPNEYFSEIFLQVENKNDRPFPRWNYKTYLDDALEGNLGKDNYTLDEQEYLLSPVWKQVSVDHPEFKNYPPNINVESDVMIRSDPSDYPIDNLTKPSYQFIVIDQPTLEGTTLVDLKIKFEALGFKPITNDEIIKMLDEVWADEIESNPYFPKHTIVSENDWYGAVAVMYDEYGNTVHSPALAAYHIADTDIIRISTDTNTARVIRNAIVYNLD